MPKGMCGRGWAACVVFGVALLAHGAEPATVDTPPAVAQAVAPDKPEAQAKPAVAPQAAPAKPAAPPATPKPVEKPPVDTAPIAPPPPAPAPGLRFHLLDGSIVTGEPSVPAFTIHTAFGELAIPVDQVQSFTPGLRSHPEHARRLEKLIQELGSPNAKQRDAAEASLTDEGPAVRALLERFAADADAERRTRIRTILESFDELELDIAASGSTTPRLIDEDELETAAFKVVGRLEPQAFAVETRFGTLRLTLADIRRAQRDQAARAEQRRTLTVSGANLTHGTYKVSGIQLQRGDRVVISADGTLVMAPWGNNATSTPDGSPQFDWFVPEKIPGGALVARVGSTGQVFKVGTAHEFVATKPGTLSFAIAISPQFAHQGYNFPGEYRIKVTVNPR